MQFAVWLHFEHKLPAELQKLAPLLLAHIGASSTLHQYHRERIRCAVRTTQTLGLHVRSCYVHGSEHIETDRTLLQFEPATKIYFVGLEFSSDRVQFGLQCDRQRLFVFLHFSKIQTARKNLRTHDATQPHHKLSTKLVLLQQSLLSSILRRTDHSMVCFPVF